MYNNTILLYTSTTQYIQKRKGRTILCNVITISLVKGISGICVIFTFFEGVYDCSGLTG
jgi:hypothetical protein